MFSTMPKEYEVDKLAREFKRLRLINGFQQGYYLWLFQDKVRMTKVIKGEFEKIKNVMVEDVSLTCDTPLEVFNNEVSRLSGMDDDLFTYEVKVSNIPCNSNMDGDSEHEADDDIGYDPSDIRGDDEVELIDEESSDDMDEVAETYLLRTLMDSRPMKITRMIGSMNGTRTYHGSMRSHGLTSEFGPYAHQLNILASLFNYKTVCSEWPTYSWKDDGYYNGGNLPLTHIIGNQLHYQGLEWYEALEDCELKYEALKNKAIMEGSIKEDDDESQYVAVKEDEYDDLTITRKEACRAYQEIFRIMDEGWMVTRAE
ncbi:hypothetical protein Tco_0347449 [Tanacetum coccineum]